MSREAHVQFCESLGVRFPGATHPYTIRLGKVCVGHSVKRDRVGREHIRKNLLEHGPYLRMAFQWAVWRNEHRIGSIVRHDRLDITGLESLPVMEQCLFRLFTVGSSHIAHLRQEW